MTTLRERLVFDTAQGAVRDGDRRYLLMRADVLMGALRALEPAARGAMLAAMADVVRYHGGRSLDAYAEAAPGDPQALIDATLAAAADLGWGRWMLQADADGLHLVVQHSPFAAGWLMVDGDAGANAGALADVSMDAATPAVAVCAPITGMLRALATRVRPAPPGARLVVQESSCMAAGADCCRFEARWTGAT
ncbi:MAG: hypothetical protein ACKVQR_21625 [Aquabacterium sp.]